MAQVYGRLTGNHADRDGNGRSAQPGDVYPDPVSLVLVPDARCDEATNQRRFTETYQGWMRWAPELVLSVGAGNHMTALRNPHAANLAALLTRS